MNPWVRYLIAAVVAFHGLVYFNAARGVLPVFEGWKGTSWLLGSAVTGDALRRLCVALWALAGVGIMAAALAFAFAGQAVWRPLAIGAAAVGILGFLAFWDGQGRRLFEEGALGAGLSLLMLVAAAVAPRVLGAR